MPAMLYHRRKRGKGTFFSDFLKIKALTRNDDMTKIFLIGLVVDAEPADVEDCQLTRK